MKIMEVMSETYTWMIILGAIILVGVALLCILFWIGWRGSQRSQEVSPYIGIPLRRAVELPYYSIDKIVKFMDQLHQYDNRPFKLNRAAFCRETGRIFPNCITLWDTIQIDWNFLRKRYPGHYVSWGSLSKEQQNEIQNVHDPLEGFQMEYSSPTPAPRAIEPKYAYTRPGPLYVDIETKVLLGWKQVPGTEFEVLIVQKPIK
jgi:hypothetical protein